MSAGRCVDDSSGHWPLLGVLAAAGAANRRKLSGAIRADVPTQCRLEADGSTKNRTVQVNIHAQSGTGLVIEMDAAIAGMKTNRRVVGIGHRAEELPVQIR